MPGGRAKNRSSSGMRLTKCDWCNGLKKSAAVDRSPVQMNHPLACPSGGWRSPWIGHSQSPLMSELETPAVGSDGKAEDTRPVNTTPWQPHVGRPPRRVFSPLELGGPSSYGCVAKLRAAPKRLLCRADESTSRRRRPISPQIEVLVGLAGLRYVVQISLTSCRTLIPASADHVSHAVRVSGELDSQGIGRCQRCSVLPNDRRRCRFTRVERLGF